METRYIWALGILLVWIVLRLILMFRRRARLDKWLKEREAEEAQEAQASEQRGGETAAPDAKHDSNPTQP
ncbi:MAG TPA: hypothetical protein VKX17_27380 [Planctomycetota bacterium]|nr:hypothetical protein [Planctomycetota bacterium]